MDDYWKGVATEVKRDRAKYYHESSSLRHPPFRGFGLKTLPKSAGAVGGVPRRRLPLKAKP